jgi:hypothetical protein
MEAQTRTARGRWARWVFVFFTLGVAAVAWEVSARRARAHAQNSQAAVEGPSAVPAGVPGWASTPAPLSLEREPSRPRFGAPRWAATLTLTTLFFAGASFTAFAGDQAAQLFDGDAAVAVVEAGPAPEEVAPATTEETAPAEEVEVELEPEVVAEPPVAEAVEPAAVPEVAEPVVEEPVAEAPAAETPAPVEEAPAAEPAAVEETEPAPAHGAPVSTPAAEPVAKQPSAAARVAPKAVKPQPVSTPAPQAVERQELDPEATVPGVHATIWLHRELGDPTPPSLRLSRAAASRLVSLSKREGARWELVLGLLRADGSRSLPSRARTIADAARIVSGKTLDRDGWRAALEESGRTAAADRAVALAHYYRAVGLEALVDGLLAREDALAGQVLADERVTLYFGGREDVAAGRVDVRVLALVAYLAESYGQVTVSSLISGHRLYSRPGVVSAHVYGQAVDISSLSGLSIAGHQEPGGLTEKAVRDILLLPAEVRPRQLISLLGLGGPSFPLADHDDHIHVGF